jgi:putative ABC transport system permease protein
MLISHYWVTAYRFFLRQKIYAIINGLGLAIGMASCLIMVLIAIDDTGFDQFHPHARRIYRVAVDLQFPDRLSHSAITPFPLAEAIKQNKKIAEDAIRLVRLQNLSISTNDSTRQSISRALITDSNFFNFFGFDLLWGDKSTCLITDSSVVLTESTAKRFLLPGQTVKMLLGRQLTIQGDYNQWTITGIAADPPRKSHFKFDILLPLKEEEQGRWDWFVTWTYIRVPHHVSLEFIKSELKPFQEYFYKAIKDKFKLENSASQDGIHEEFFLQSIGDIHLRSHLDHELEQNSRVEYTYALLFTAVMVLMISCFNHVNLSTARWTKRAKEIGVRKMVGASRQKILIQFLGESLIMTLGCLIAASAIVYLALPIVNLVTEKNIRLDELPLFNSLVFLIAFGLVVSLISGAYPAFLVSSFDVSQIFRNQKNGLGGITIRKRLVVMQFFFGILLFICTITDFRQVHYLTQVEHLGFDKGRVMVIENALALGADQKRFKDELVQLKDVEHASYASQNPIDVSSSIISQTSGERSMQVGSEIISIDADFERTLGVEMVWGKSFDSSLALASQTSAIINESFLKKTYLESPANMKVILHNFQKDTLQIIGMTKDFRHKPFKLESGPLLLVRSSEAQRFLLIRSDEPKMIAVKEQVAEIWKKYVPQTGMNAYTLNEKINEQLYLESELGSITLFFTMLAIFVACLGLMGLATFTGEMRAKEIAMRKVLGATTVEIVYLLVRQYGFLVSISFLLAAPTGWFLMDWWLDQYPSRISLNGWVIFLSGFSCLAVALTTVIYQSISVAQKNPSETLRSE